MRKFVHFRAFLFISLVELELGFAFWWCVLGSLEDMAVWAQAMDVGVGLGLAMGVDQKKAEACGGEEPKDVRWEERGLGDPFVVGDGSSTRTYTPLAQFGLEVRGHERRHRRVRRCGRTRQHRRLRRRYGPGAHPMLPMCVLSRCVGGVSAIVHLRLILPHVCRRSGADVENGFMVLRSL